MHCLTWSHHRPPLHVSFSLPVNEIWGKLFLTLWLPQIDSIDQLMMALFYGWCTQIFLFLCRCCGEVLSWVITLHTPRNAGVEVSVPEVKDGSSGSGKEFVHMMSSTVTTKISSSHLSLQSPELTSKDILLVLLFNQNLSLGKYGFFFFNSRQFSGVV